MLGVINISDEDNPPVDGVEADKMNRSENFCNDFKMKKVTWILLTFFSNYKTENFFLCFAKTIRVFFNVTVKHKQTIKPALR